MLIPSSCSSLGYVALRQYPSHPQNRLNLRYHGFLVVQYVKVHLCDPLFPPARDAVYDVQSCVPFGRWAVSLILIVSTDPASINYRCTGHCWLFRYTLTVSPRLVVLPISVLFPKSASMETRSHRKYDYSSWIGEEAMGKEMAPEHQ